MCGRYAIDADQADIDRHFHVHQPTFVLDQPRPEVFPSEAVPVVGIGQYGSGYDTRAMRWGFVPHWWDERQKGKPKVQINARVETVSELPYFRDALKSRRCMVPATSFFEWRKIGSKSTRHRIKLNNYGMFAFAGLWDEWQGEKRVAIITVPANSTMQ